MVALKCERKHRLVHGKRLLRTHTKSLTFIGLKKKRRQLTTKSIVPSALENFKKKIQIKQHQIQKHQSSTANISKDISKKTWCAKLEFVHGG